MSKTSPAPHAKRVSDLDARAPNRFQLVPSAQVCTALARELGVDVLRKLRFEGQIDAHGKADWLLQGQLGATVVQPCTVTLAPVTTRIEADVTRVFVAEYSEPDLEEAEMPEDETVEPLGVWIDPEAVMVEALSLEIPDYPKSDTASFDGAVFAERGVTPMTDEDAKPFAGLAALKVQMSKKE